MNPLSFVHNIQKHLEILLKAFFLFNPTSSRQKLFEALPHHNLMRKQKKRAGE